ncbi:hypothetical protein A3G55_00105 [Candidatus Giovannonibacteria bacterium RIFCSPLOWO2_12_FULL_44_25]|uniref:Uncharacterized protein n=4 Tax=Parcubacteria group TaxID=1794811 RepID=A0A837IKT6_9BACT|nr:MAG: hypothetical protein UW15_C0013G0019 [Parcubacteria group bacterium GW2011_GWC1_44_10]KKT57331.1 MAG: hypothetical protein UW49_C0005G0019 [Candidatus Giovannonibacteria bacterium GW2011_GWB1_44_23]KKT59679.1 MAG: hypothetical protein UW53_C0009G0019 [Candidatus Giovannonibacteria bacterium GW2011_GWA1_44_25]KKU12991.1 MAG: hypothetical protein UX18_C0004G0007 [Candidatus Azambacteria bacterium GW2011_GWC2_45_7b]OGF50056.1 MAG: hypothetical protein A2120_02915 [Candidatus Giovannonibact
MLTDKFGEKITTSELLAAILALVPDFARIAGREKVHTLFGELRAYHPILREFDGFDTRWPQVWSEKLDEAFRWLSLSRMIKQDGEFHAFGITQDATEIVKEKILSRFTTEQILDAREVARIISERIVCKCDWCRTISKSLRM